MQIKHIKETVIYESKKETFGKAVEEAVINGVNLRGADLRDANLYGVDLSGANLNGVNLCGANLSGSYLGGANLNGVDLSGANLSGANLNGANLSGANLNGANLGGANLSGAYLNGAYLNGAYLCGANWGEGVVVLSHPVSVTGLLWPVLIYGSHMRIGCEVHAVAEWDSFDDDKIATMDKNALKFWRANKVRLLSFRDKEAEHLWDETLNPKGASDEYIGRRKGTIRGKQNDWPSYRRERADTGAMQKHLRVD